MNDLWQDLRFALRSLGKRPLFTLVAVATLALGIGANTAVFTVVDAVLLRPLSGVADADRLVEVVPTTPGGASSFSYADFLDLRERSTTLQDLALFELASVGLATDDGAEALMAMVVSGNYFAALGTRPAAGRFFADDEFFPPGVPPVAVVSDGLWQRRFGGDPGLVGRRVVLNGVPVTVVGVAPPRAGIAALLAPDLWLPLGLTAPGLPSAASLAERGNSSYDAFGRLAPGVGMEEAEAELNLLYQQLAQADGRERPPIEVASTGQIPSTARGPAGGFSAVLMTVVGLVLMIACVNVAGLLFVHGLGRTREIALRQALGAGRGRLVRLLVTETLTLFALGGTGGVLLAAAGSRLLTAWQPPLPPPLHLDVDVSLDGRVLGFALLISLAAGLASGLVPALRATRTDLVPSIKSEARNAGRGAARLRAFLVGVQTAVTLVLLIASGLFLRALGAARDADLGFRTENVDLLALDVTIKGLGAEPGRAYYRTLVERVAAMPGVESTAIARKRPIDSGTSFGGVNVEGFAPPVAGGAHPAWNNVVSPGYFRTVGIPLVAGRDFQEGDGKSAIVNETMARRFWGGARQALGKPFLIGSFEHGASWEVVGVARDAAYHRDAGEETPSFVYLPLSERFQSEVWLHVRKAKGGPSLAALREAVNAVDPALPALAAMSLEKAVEMRFLPQRVASSVAGVLGLAGLLLAVVGIYGATAFAVAHRLHEVGVRMALGATGRDVLRFVLAKAVRAPAVGLVAGLGAAALLSRFLEAILQGLNPLDPVTFGGVGLLLGIIVLGATLLPVRRVVRTEPMAVLRDE